jgi:hypothetical protein
MGFISLKDWRARSAGLAQAASRAKTLLHPAFGLSEADALSVNEIGCPDVETVVLVMRAGEPTRALRFRGPLDDLDEAAARALALEEAGLRAL